MRGTSGRTKRQSSDPWAQGIRAALAILIAAAIAMTDAAVSAQEPPPALESALDPDELTRSVTIYRDDFGVPHVDGPTDVSVVFGFAYAQAEDYFWQIEDTYILALGRYAEVHGAKGLNSDLLNRAFEIIPTSQADYTKLEPEIRALCEAYAAGLNYYLAKNPQTKPRLITRFEPWHLVAYGRHLLVEMAYRYTRLSDSMLPRQNETIYARRGSNAWAVAPEKTASGNAMLFVNPHQPWFGFGQFCEGHLRSGEGWNFSGATFFGSPFPALGHNEHLGWAFTVNEPDIADAWIETFDNPSDRLAYRYGDSYRQATEWQDTISVRTGRGVQERTYTFLKTHHGPIVRKQDDEHYIAVRIAKMYDSMLLRQARKMLRAKNFDEFRDAMATLNFQFFNAVYADREGNIYYVYNGTIPRRDPAFDWSKPVDGSDPRTEWQGYHPLAELPQVLNPASGYVQNCNSSPFTTTDDGNPFLKDFPPYMVEDKHDDKRRAKMCRLLLREMQDVTFEDMQRYAFDTTIYWALMELPKFRRQHAKLESTDPELAERVAPYLEHLLDWDCRGSADSTQTTLLSAWYEELYGFGYPAETLKSRYVDKPAQKFRALINAATKLKSLYGDWKVAWGDVNRIQRHANVADFFEIPFDDKLPSLPCEALNGPLGVVFVAYYTPAIQIPLVRTVKKHYGVVGNTYMGVFEFGDKIRGATLQQFGQSGDPDSPHFMDQAQLMSRRQLKPELFYWDDVIAAAVRKYHPGEEGEGDREGATGSAGGS